MQVILECRYVLPESSGLFQGNKIDSYEGILSSGLFQGNKIDSYEGILSSGLFQGSKIDSYEGILSSGLFQGNKIDSYEGILSGLFEELEGVLYSMYNSDGVECVIGRAARAGHATTLPRQRNHIFSPQNCSVYRLYSYSGYFIWTSRP